MRRWEKQNRLSAVHSPLNERAIPRRGSSGSSSLVRNPTTLTEADRRPSRKAATATSSKNIVSPMTIHSLPINPFLLLFMNGKGQICQDLFNRPPLRRAPAPHPPGGSPENGRGRIGNPGAATCEGLPLDPFCVYPPASCAKFPVGNPRTISLDGPSPAAATILPCKGSESFPPPNPSLENRWNKTPPPRIRQREGASAFPGIHRQPPGGRAGGLSPADPPV